MNGRRNGSQMKDCGRKGGKKTQWEKLWLLLVLKFPLHVLKQGFC